ncbi:MAG: transporter [Draconibacterium sp.]|nr:transporter [Draconibacterium sp.]
MAKFDAIVPYSFGNFEGRVSGTDSSTTRTGFGDPLIRVSIILIGAKPLTMSEFATNKPQKFKLGVNSRVKLPIGQYDKTKFINLGSNRWALKLGVAGSYSIQKRVVIEAQVNTWFFAKNDEFFNGNTIEQKPLLSGQIHGTWIFKPGVWAAVSFGRSAFGETIINGVEKEDLKNSSRFGAAFAYRVSKHSSLKVAVTSGLSTRYGADFTSILVAYQFMWFDKT